MVEVFKLADRRPVVVTVDLHGPLHGRPQAHVVRHRRFVDRLAALAWRTATRTAITTTTTTTITTTIATTTTTVGVRVGVGVGTPLAAAALPLPFGERRRHVGRGRAIEVGKDILRRGVCR